MDMPILPYCLKSYNFYPNCISRVTGPKYLKYMILTIFISMVLKRNRGLSLDIGSHYETAEHKTHTHKSQKLDTISATS